VIPTVFENQTGFDVHDLGPGSDLVQLHLILYFLGRDAINFVWEMPGWAFPPSPLLLRATITAAVMEAPE
jgi:hypothetical protein